jgi:antitoxin VapB
MGMNIKNEETLRLVRELAALTGESQTAAITAAVRERLARIRKVNGPNRVERILAIGRKCAKELPEWALTVDYDDLIYDEFGLPK